MVGSKRRFVDSHMHLWDLSQNDWYRFPQPGNDFGMGLKKPFPDRFTLDDYIAALSSVDLVKCVHVTAVTGPGDVASESAWIADIARERGLPNAIVGTIDLNVAMPEIEAALDGGLEDPSYRGIRVLGSIDYKSDLASSLLEALETRNLIYDAVAHPGGGISAAAKGLAGYPGLVTVLEHTGWPLAIDDEAFAEWKSEMEELAALPNTFCKLSGLGMTVHRTDTPIFRRYFDACISMFGAERCMFGSNFPVDLSYGSADDLLAVFENVASQYSSSEADFLFAGTAEKVYRL